MALHRELFVGIIAAVAAVTLAGCSTPAPEPGTDAPEFPLDGKPITLVVGWDAGGGTDLSARNLATALEAELGTTIVVENQPGAGSQIASEQFQHAAPDGYTISMMNTPTTNAIYVDAERGATFTADSFDLIANHDSDPIGIAVAPESDIDDIKELIRMAEDEPGSVTTGNSGLFSAVHLGLLEFQRAADVTFETTVFENAGQLRVALLGGDITIEAGTLSELIPAHQAGQIRLIGTLAQEPIESISDVPTAIDSGYDVFMQSNRMIAAPAGTPEEVLDILSEAIGNVLSDPDYQQMSADQSISLNYLDRSAAGELWDAMDKVARVNIEAYRESED